MKGEPWPSVRIREEGERRAGTRLPTCFSPRWKKGSGSEGKEGSEEGRREEMGRAKRSAREKWSAAREGEGETNKEGRKEGRKEKKTKKKKRLFLCPDREIKQ